MKRLLTLEQPVDILRLQGTQFERLNRTRGEHTFVVDDQNLLVEGTLGSQYHIAVRVRSIEDEREEFCLVVDDIEFLSIHAKLWRMDRQDLADEPKSDEAKRNLEAATLEIGEKLRQRTRPYLRSVG